MFFIGRFLAEEWFYLRDFVMTVMLCLNMAMMELCESA